MKKNIKEVRNWLLENRTDEFGNLNLRGLDFSDFNGNVEISHMTVKGDLFQDCHQVYGNLFQDSQSVQGTLNQSFQSVDGDLKQQEQYVSGDLDQDRQVVDGDLFQLFQEVGGSLYQGVQIVGKNLYQTHQTAKGHIETYKPTEDEVVEEREDCLVIRKK